MGIVEVVPREPDRVTPLGRINLRVIRPSPVPDIEERPVGATKATANTETKRVVKDTSRQAPAGDGAP